MKKLRRERLLLLFLSGCFLIGSLGIWIQFPLSAPVHGLDWNGADPVWWRRYAAVPFVLCMGLALALLFSTLERYGAWLLAAAIVALFAVPVTALLLDAAWVERYVNDGIERDRFQFLITFLGGIPNTNFNPFVTSADAFQYLPDRLRIVGNLLGWGWTLCLFAALGIVLVMRRLERIPSLRAVLLPGAAGTALIALLGSSVLMADLRYRQADQRLGRGDYRGALEAYATAIGNDPMLGQSRLFLLNVAKAYYQVGGSGDPRGQLYADQTLGAVEQASAKARLAASATYDDGTTLGRALTRMARRREAELWVNQGMVAYSNGDLGSAAASLRLVLARHQNWNYVRFFLARVLGRLREFDEARRHLESLLMTTHDVAFKATIHNALGDVHAAAGRLEQARAEYAQGYALDKTGNLWAVKGLGGT